MGLVLVCAGRSLAPVEASAGWVRGAGDAALRLEWAGLADELILLEEAEEGSVAGGKLLLTKRLKLIIKYHAVIPA